MIWWFRKEPETDETEYHPPRVATDEYLYGLAEIADIYEAREKMNRTDIIEIAERLSKKEFFNYKELDKFVNEIKESILSAIKYQNSSREIRDWIQGYKYRGYIPKHMKSPKKDEKKIEVD